MTWKLVGGFALLVVGSIAHPACTLSSRPTPAGWGAAEDAAGGADPGLAFTHVDVVEVESGRILPEQTVLMADNRISNVGPAGSVPIPAGARVVGARGKYLVPGLWDMHVHSSSDRITRETFLPLYIANGVTGVRDMAADCFAPCHELDSSFEHVLRWRREIAAATHVGPRVVAASPMIQSPPRGEPSSMARPATAAEARALVRQMKERRVDLLKLYTRLSREAYFALVDEARRQGIPVAGHVPLAVRATEASDAGQRSVELFWGLKEECSEREDELRPRLEAELGERGSLDHYLSLLDSFSEERCSAVAARFVENGTWHVPTLVALEMYERIGDDGWLDDPRLRYVAAEEEEYWRSNLMRAADLWSGGLGATAAMNLRFKEIVAIMRAAGAGLLAGSDVGDPFVFPGFSLHEELELLVAAGLSPAEALRAATLGPAEYLEATDSLGAVAPGKLADLVLLDGNPLEDIRNTQRIRAVVANGRYFDRDALDRLLADVETAAARRPDTVHVAPPTGTRDVDRASILAALERVRPGGTVQFAPGTYLVGGHVISVRIPEVTLLGHGEGTTLRGCDPPGLEDEQFNQHNCNGIELAGARQSVRNLTFEFAFWALHLGRWEQLERAEYRLPDGTIAPIPALYPTEGGHLIEGNTFRSSSSGIRVNGDWSDPAIIRGNRFLDNWHAVSINGSIVHLLDNDFAALEPERVPLTGFPRDAIKISPTLPFQATGQTPGTCAHNIVAGNRIEGVPEAIRIEVYFPGESCRYNVVRDNTIRVRRVPHPPAIVERWKLAEPTFIMLPIALLNETGMGIVDDNLVEGNRIIGAEGLGIEVLHASRNRIASNTIRGVVRRDPFPGEFARSAPGWLEANGSGIWISPGSEENEIAGNTFEDIAAHTVVLEGDRNHVELRTATDAVRDLGSGNRVSLSTDRVEAVHRLTDRFIAAWNDDLPDLVERFYTRDAVLTLAGGTGLVGRHAIVETFVRPNVARIGGMRSVGDPQVSGIGDTITSDGWYRARFAPSPDTVTIRVSNRWVLQSDGSWLITASTFELPKDDVDGPIRSRFVHSDGTRLHYLDFGGDGLPVVFIPSANRTAYTYIDFAARFTDRHRVLALTRRGSGQSGGEAGEAVTNVARLARDVLALLDSLGIERAVVVDRWTEIPIYLAEQHPERLAGLVILRGVPPEPDPFELRAQDATQLLEMYDRAGAAMFGRDPDRSGPRKEEWYEPRFLRTGAKIEVPALSFIIESVTPRWEVEWGFRVGLADEVTSDPRSFPDSISRLFFQRLATDPRLQADVQVFYQNAFAPAWQAAERAFFDAFSDHRVVRLEGENPRNYYQYRHAPELIYSHIRDFLDEVGVRERGRSSAAAPGPPQYGGTRLRVSKPITSEKIVAPMIA